MATPSYFYVVYLTEQLNGTNVYITTPTVKANVGDRFVYQVVVYQNDGSGNITQFTNTSAVAVTVDSSQNNYYYYSGGVGFHNIVGTDDTNHWYTMVPLISAIQNAKINVFTPKINVNFRSDNSAIPFHSGYGYSLDSSGNWYTPVVPGSSTAPDLPASQVTSIQTINVTKAIKQPAVPQQVLSHANGQTNLCKYNQATGQWTAVTVTDNHNGTWNVFVTNYKADGTQVGSTTLLGTDSQKSGGPAYLKAQAFLVQADTSNTSNPKTLVPKPDNTTSTSTPVPPPTDLDSSSVNPPTNTYSRTVSYSDIVKLKDVYIPPEKNPLIYTEVYKLLQTPNTLGKIRQDPNTAGALNGSKSKGLPSGVKINGVNTRIWGFNFMYNPTTISYSTQANNSVDWTYGSKDPAALLQGNTSVTFDLYLNRIVDLQVLKGNNYSKMYGGVKLTDKQVNGILSRGTEYDLEYLYRVVNGDPTPNNPLLNNGDKEGTADYGYVTGVPFWLYLSDNLRYFGSLASINVNHVMFTPNMVPMLSVVSLTIARYPSIATQTSDGKSYYSDYQTFAKYLTSSGQTPPSGG